MAAARYGHTATLLPNGNVLVAGGYGAGGPNGEKGPLASAELYDSETNTWKAAAPLATGRHYHTATLLPGGKVVVEV